MGVQKEAEAVCGGNGVKRRIVWQLLNEKRDFENRPFRAKINYSPAAPH
jgi:hypothetical protein